jgi:hypothetical protein
VTARPAHFRRRWGLLETPNVNTIHLGSSKARQFALLGFLLRVLFFAEDDFALANELVV